MGFYFIILCITNFLLLIAFAFTSLKYIIYIFCFDNDEYHKQQNKNKKNEKNNNKKKTVLLTIIAVLLDSISAWLGTSWISTIILGGPVLIALYGESFQIYGIYAALSSFFCQLPTMIMILEIQSTFADSLPFLDRPSIATIKHVHDGININNQETTKLKANVSKSNESPTVKKNSINTRTKVTTIRKVTNTDPTVGDSQALLKQAGNDMTVTVKKVKQIENNNSYNDGDEDDMKIELGVLKTANIDSQKQNGAQTDDSQSIVGENGSGLCRRIIKKILFAFVKNPVIWAIVIGFILSFIYSGEDLDVIEDFPEWLANGLLSFDGKTGLGVCTTPVGVFVIGLFTSEQSIKWMKYILNSMGWNLSFNCNSHPNGDNGNDYSSNYNKNKFGDGDNNNDGDVGTTSIRNGGLAIFLELFCYLFIKFFIAPALMLGIAKNMFNLKCDIGRSAVIIATVPTSLASFTLTKRFELSSQSVMAFNVIIGTILMLPFVLMWLEIMDENDHFVCDLPNIAPTIDSHNSTFAPVNESFPQNL